jgi:hypothetical protein
LNQALSNSHFASLWENGWAVLMRRIAYQTHIKHRKAPRPCQKLNPHSTRL